MEPFTSLWNFIWLGGWTSFLLSVLYMVVGGLFYRAVLDNIIDRRTKVDFIKFSVFCFVCGPVGWLAYIAWLGCITYGKLITLISNIDIKKISRWLVDDNAR